MRRRLRTALVAAVVLLMLIVPTLVDFYTDWLWFGETGYQNVFLRTVASRITLGAVATVLALAVLLINIRVAMRHFPVRQFVFATREGPIAIPFDSRRARAVSVAAATAVAIVFGLYASSQWLEWLLFLRAQPFGEIDPILGRDASFYVFRLPFLDTLRGFLLTLVALSGLASAAVYVLAGALTFDPRRGIRITAPAKQHLAILAASWLVVLAFAAYLDVPRILNTPAGIVHGAANVDVAVRIPALRVLMVVALVGAALALYQRVAASWWPIITAAALYVTVATGGAVAAALMQRFVIAPNEQARETPFIEHNIAATRKAFGLDKVEERELSGDALLTRADIDANTATLGNVRLWDHQPLLADIRPDPGDPHLLRLRLGAQRPLPHRR